uniref:Methyltransferase domain-containing protein n=1 Tax=Thermodesulfobacterium geofontis TaxID=1295609 RepID=A0A7C4NQI1_9BACT
MEKRYLTNIGKLSENSRGMKNEKENFECWLREDTYGTHFIDLYPTRENVIKCDVNRDKFPFKDNYFDEIVAIELFEHLTNPLNFLKECYRTLKRN